MFRGFPGTAPTTPRIATLLSMHLDKRILVFELWSRIIHSGRTAMSAGFPYRIARAGTPMTEVPGGTLRITTEPAPIVAKSPTVMPCKTDA